MAPRPCSPTSLTGLELELLGPVTRAALARALVRGAFPGGRVEYGYKFLDLGPVAGRTCCELVPATRIVRNGQVEVTLVDDLSISDGVPTLGQTTWRLVMDDVRLATWVERNQWSPEPRSARRLEALRESFGATVQPRGVGCSADQALLTDARGHRLAVQVPTDAGREHVAELVTRPLGRHEREGFLRRVLAVAKGAGFSVAPQGSLHLHVDAAPWRATARLRQLVLDFTSQREALLAQTCPNACTEREWRGPFPKPLVRRCQRLRSSRPFREVADELLGLGVVKTLDVNLVWVLERWPRLPTLEFRALGASLDADVVLARVAVVESFLREVARRADARRPG